MTVSLSQHKNFKWYNRHQGDQEKRGPLRGWLTGCVSISLPNSMEKKKDNSLVALVWPIVSDVLRAIFSLLIKSR